MVDYNELRKKFPVKDARKRKKSLAIKSIAREYEQKKAAIGGLKAPSFKKGLIFYGVMIIGLTLLGSLVLTATGKGGRAPLSKAQIQVRKSVDALAVALGRYRYHVGEYPSTEEGLENLASKTVKHKGWNGPYIRQVVKDPWKHDYVYHRNGEGENPTLYSKGPDGIAGTTDDILPDPKLFDEPFRDTTWTQGWMPHHLRGYVLVPDKKYVAQVEAEVQSILNPVLPIEGETVLREGWEFTHDTNTTWQAVHVPHDWAIAGPFDVTSQDGSTGKLPWKGVGYYRRSLTVPKSAAGSFVALRFGGVMARPEIFLNGEKVGSWDYGYMSFEVDISKQIRFGEANDLLVKVDTRDHQSRWYPGAGIYRDVTLVVEDQEDRMLYGSLKITTSEISPERARVHVEYETPLGAVANDLIIENPILWSPERPFLYTYRICGKPYRYGIRTARFTAEDGFHLNGQRLQLKGVNLHSDLGILGMAFNRDVLRRSLSTLKDMGVNAIRTAHNAPDSQLLDLCDEMGFVVWNECFDKWDGTAGIKPEEDQDAYVIRNLQQFVRRDRNHPSVVCWSIGNEILHKTERYPQGTDAERCAKYRAAILAEDSTRPVGIGCCHVNCVESGDYESLDLTGWNYRERYRLMKVKYPQKPIVYSESASTVSSYNYFGPPSLTDITSYDTEATAWSDIPEVEFDRMKRDTYVAGEFVWTGLDYLGEPTPLEKTNRSSFFGICDLTGYPKDRYYLYRAHWNPRETTVHLLPHWNWEGREGEKITVMCYTNGDAAELYLNGESQGKCTKEGKYRLIWEVPYEAGELKVIAFKDGQPIGEAVRETTDSAVAVRLTPEATELGDGELTYVEVDVTDEEGRRHPLAQNQIAFSLEGPGEILSVGNGSTAGMASFKAVASHALYNGRAVIIVRRTGGSGLPLKLTATAQGLRKAVLTLPRR